MSEGIIGIKDLRVRCIIGCRQQERLEEQEIFLDVKIKTDFSNVLQSDHIEHTINYSEVGKLITTTARDNQYQTIEALAGGLINVIHKQFPVSWVWVRVKKPLAMSSAQYVLVELER